MSDLPDNPIDNLYCEYLMAVINPIFVAVMNMDAMHSLPVSSLSATLKNLLLGFSISDLKLPTPIINILILTIFSDVIDPVEHVLSGHSHSLEIQSPIVDTVQAHLPTHVYYLHTLAWLHLVVPDPHNEAVNSLVLPLNYSLCENDSIVRVTSAICYPVLLR